MPGGSVNHSSLRLTATYINRYRYLESHPAPYLTPYRISKSCHIILPVATYVGEHMIPRIGSNLIADRAASPLPDQEVTIAKPWAGFPL
jgi:hypothetical protein